MTPRMDPVPIACNLAALAPPERERRAELAATVKRRVRTVRETAAGIVLSLEPAPETLSLVHELIALERRCCPFLEFRVQEDAEIGALELEIGGPAGVRAFLMAAFVITDPAP